MTDIDKRREKQREYYRNNVEKFRIKNKKYYIRRCNNNCVPRRFTFIDYIKYLLEEDKKLNQH
jgi:hypothetical protein